jgi:hypothetical protein
MSEPRSGLDDTSPASSPPEGADAPAPAPATGERYRLGAELGRGGMGRVVEAFDTQLGRIVAYKEVLPNAAAGLARRFRREVEITARLEHPSIVPLYDSGTTSDGRPFYVMRRVTGRPLDELIARTRTLADRMALLPHLLAAAEAIGHAHKRGVIHRDLKPGNILVGELGETVVIDWGLAKVVGEKEHTSNEPTVPAAADSLQTQIGSVFGTPGFMAPEQARGEELDTAGDVFALGACLYHLLSGRPPVRGTSATEVIASTLKHDIKPLRAVVEGVPAELAAIVAKALAFEAKDRYANAGELAEDLRRFTTGQLVAAHDYTRLQRLTRFARRNRAPLTIAALALVGVAAVSWIGVHSVMRERDVANSERAHAQEQAALAQKRAAELAQRADQLRLMHARTLLDANPTQALAVLKDMTMSPATLPDAQAIAKAAVMRGVAWGLPSLPGFTIALQLSHDGRRLLQISRDGKLQIIELDARRVIGTHDLAKGMSGAWAAGDTRVFLAPEHAPPQLYDPASGKTETLPPASCREWSITDRGELVACIDEADAVELIDIATGAAKTIWTGKAGSALAIAPDGSWIALDAGKQLLVIDRNGKELLHRDGRVQALTVSATGKLAAISDGAVFEAAPASNASTVVPLEGKHLPLYLAYRGDVLDIFEPEQILAWNGRAVWPEAHVRDGALWGSPAGDRLLVAPSQDGRVHVIGDGIDAELHAPTTGDQITRVAARPGVSRFVTTCRDALCVWNLADVVPRRLALGHPGFFLDDSRLVIDENLVPDWRWADLDSGADGRLPKGPIGLPERIQVGRDGRLLVIVNDGKPETTAAVYSADLARVTRLDGVSGTLARLVPGDAVVAAVGKGKLVGAVGDHEPREILRLDGDVIGLFEAGPQRFVALSSKGELVRMKLDGSDLARAHVAIDPGAFLVADSRGRAVVATGAHLYRWDAQIDDLATMTKPIDSLSVLDGALLVFLEGGEMYYFPDGGAPRRLPLAAGRDTRIAERAPAVFGMTGGQISVLDLPSLAAWTLPKTFAGLDQYAVSPDGHRVVQVLGGESVAAWELPRPGGDFAAWLDELTNATEDDGIFSWPWQKRGP